MTRMLRPIQLAMSGCSKRVSPSLLASTKPHRVISRKAYATVSSSVNTVIGQSLHQLEAVREEFSEFVPPLVDSLVLQAAAEGNKTTLPDIIKQYIDTSGTVLDVSLPYESRPPETRRPALESAVDSFKNVIMVAHCAQVGTEHKITLSSGFALNVRDNGEGEKLILTCAHTLEEIRQSPLLLSETSPSDSVKRLSGTFVVAGSGDSLGAYPISRIVSALPRSDLLLLSCPVPSGVLNSLPVSPYPAHRNAVIRAHFVMHDKPAETGWSSWVGDTWGNGWKARFLDIEISQVAKQKQPGTYDALSHLLFTPLPTAGSSGGPIIDEESGAVVGVILGTRMDNRVEGVRGWGVPSETIFEMFTLPGLEGKK